jgi:hypothetical protein
MGLIYMRTSSGKQKGSKSRKLAQAREEHRQWLEDRGLAPRHISAKQGNLGSPDTMPDLKVGDHPVPLSNGFAPVVGKRTAMEIRFKEKPEVRAEIERKAMRIAPLYNKGGTQYVSDGDQTRYEGKVRK